MKIELLYVCMHVVCATSLKDGRDCPGLWLRDQPSTSILVRVMTIIAQTSVRVLQSTHTYKSARTTVYYMRLSVTTCVSVVDAHRSISCCYLINSGRWTSMIGSQEGVLIKVCQGFRPPPQGFRLARLLTNENERTVCADGDHRPMPLNKCRFVRWWDN